MSTEQRVLAVPAADLARALAGSEMTVTTLDGEEVVLRLATADELIRFNREARASLREQLGFEVGEELTRDQAEAAARPWRL